MNPGLRATQRSPEPGGFSRSATDPQRLSRGNHKLARAFWRTPLILCRSLPAMLAGEQAIRYAEDSCRLAPSVLKKLGPTLGIRVTYV